MATPHTKLSCAPSEDLKAEIIFRFWRRTRSETCIEDYAPYFQFYQKTCEALYLGIRSEVKSLVTDSHEHVLAIVDVIWEYLDCKQPCKRLPLREKLQEHFSCSRESSVSPGTDLNLNNSINLALRLWLTIDIRDDVFAPAAPTIQWDDSSTLRDFIEKQFPGPRLSVFSSEKDKIMILQSDFTAVNLRRIGGIKIGWTCHLNEHLCFDREQRKLKLYTLKMCLYDQRSSPTTLIPPAVIAETMLTLRLLFPDWDPHTSKFLHKMSNQAQHVPGPHLIEEHEHFHAHAHAAHDDRLYLSDFHYWRDRLAEVCAEYGSPPTRWRQIWADRRNRLQWYTFWVAIAIFVLTVVFGVISSVAAVLQTVYAYRSLELARGTVGRKC